MALWVCEDCTTKYAVDAERCPHCGSEAHHEEGQEMPKITKHGGPSNADTETDTETESVEQPAPAADEAAGEPTTLNDSEHDGEALPVAEDGAAEREAPALKRPARNASKADWVTFAKALNGRGEIDDRDPDSLTKNQLMDVYGELGEE